MASPAAYVSSDPLVYDCSLLASRTPCIFEITATGDIDYKIVIGSVEYANSTASPNADGIIKIDVSRSVAMACTHELEIDHFTDTSVVDTKTTGVGYLRYRDTDTVSWSEEAFNYTYCRNDIDYRYKGSANNIHPYWRDKSDIYIETTDDGDNTWTVTSGFTSGVSGSGTYDFSANPVDASVNNVAQCDSITFSGDSLKLVISDVDTNSCSNNIDVRVFGNLGGSPYNFGAITIPAATSGNSYEYDVPINTYGTVPDEFFVRVTTLGGATDKVLIFTWNFEIENYITDANVDSNDNFKLEFTEVYDFVYDDDVTLYYKCLDDSSVKIIVDEVDGDGNISTTVLEHGVDFTGTEGTVSTSKTNNTWVRAYIVYGYTLYDWAFIDSSPLLTVFDKIKWYQDLPFSLSVTTYTVAESESFDLIMDDDSSPVPYEDLTAITIESVVPYNYVTGSFTYYMQHNEGMIMSPEINVTMCDFIPANPVYLAWINRYGKWDYFLFNFRQDVDYTSEVEIVNKPAEWGLNTIMKEVYSRNTKKTITVGAESLSKSDYKGMLDLMMSDYVIMLTNPLKWKIEGEQWVQVTIDKKSALENTRAYSGSVEFDIIIDRWNKL